jgi:two-component system NtrC family sensor kinase
MTRHPGSIRRQLLTLALLPAGVALPLLGLALAWWGSSALDALLVTKVRADLAVAHGYFERVRSEMGASAAALADSQALQAALARGASPAALGALLQRFKEREHVDFVNLRDASGRLVATDFGPPAEASRAAWFDGPAARSAVEVLAPQDFALLAPALQSRVAVPLLPTPYAVPTERSTEERALVLLARAPVVDGRNRITGYLQAGLLLNRNLDFIDHINEIVYPEGALPFGSRGTATLFLDDLRITTNVRLFEGGAAHRAIGTRVSREVREAVLGRGSTWLDRAFVVGDWYVSAYAPLTDGQDRRVGMLYVGFLEQPFTLMKNGVLLGIGVLFFAVMGAAAWLSLRRARDLYRPLERMALTMREVQSGRNARVGPLRGSPELGALGAHLDGLLDTVDEQTRALRRANAELDAKVEARTRELRDAQRQLLRSEKMAAIGQLTASIAHEVNNPIAVLQGNLDLMRELLGAHVETVRDELKLADEQVERMRLIVAQLLQFSRPTEYAGYVQAVDPAQALQDCLRLVGPQLARSRVPVKQDWAHTRTAAINRQELQQVLVNLLLNALQAMSEGGGELTLSTRDEDDGVTLSVMDSGPGLAPQVLRDLFQPFMTTKHDGTGLGLWISHGLIERYGGALRAKNREDGSSGAVFEVWVPGEAVV